MSIDDWRQQYENDPRSTADLVTAALGEPDEEAQWDAVCILHFRGSEEVLREAIKLGRSDCVQERELGANILGQLGVPERTFPEQSFSVLLEMLQHETESRVIEAIAVALGHHGDPRAVAPLAVFGDHSDVDVRFAIAYGLMGQTDPLAIRTLIRLTCDSDAMVRDWATFAIGAQIDTDSDEIRNALAARLNDDDEDTRGEALAGLARRGVHRDQQNG
jgi:HEAT repeat protein